MYHIIHRVTCEGSALYPSVGTTHIDKVKLRYCRGNTPWMRVSHYNPVEDLNPLHMDTPPCKCRNEETCLQDFLEIRRPTWKPVGFWTWTFLQLGRLQRSFVWITAISIQEICFKRYRKSWKRFSWSLLHAYGCW